MSQNFQLNSLWLDFIRFFNTSVAAATTRKSVLLFQRPVEGSDNGFPISTLVVNYINLIWHNPMLDDVKERKFPFQLLESRLLSVKLFQHLVSRFEVLIKRGRMGELGCHYFSCKGRKGRELKRNKNRDVPSNSCNRGGFYNVSQVFRGVNLQQDQLLRHLWKIASAIVSVKLFINWF